MKTANATMSDSWETKAVGGGGSATNYALPDETEEKMQYAFRMIMDAHRSRAMTSENEIRSMRATVEELRVANANLTKKFQSAEREIMDQQHRCQVLQKENESLAMANRQLLQRCEKYKRIQQTFSEALENSGHEDDLSGFAGLTTTNSGEYRSVTSSYTASSLPPPATNSSAGNSGIVSSVVPPLSSMSPKTTTTTTTTSSNPVVPATTTGFDSNGKDGKQFFRIVRTRLPFESFNSFLTVIKKLNSHEYTRDVAVEEAKKIFGAENADLLGDFQALISRHISSNSASNAAVNSSS